MKILNTILRVGDLDKSLYFYLNRLDTNLKRKKEIKIISEEESFNKSEY